MAMGRNLRAYHNLAPGSAATTTGGPYSLILEQRGKNEILLVENYAIVPLGEKERREREQRSRDLFFSTRGMKKRWKTSWQEL